MVLTTLISDSVSDFDLCTLILVLTFKCFIQTYFFFFNLSYFPKVFTSELDRLGLYILISVIYFWFITSGTSRVKVEILRF